MRGLGSPAVSGPRFSFVHDVVDAAPAGDLALVELSRAGERREWRFG
jgi:hypothetical protein